MRKDRSTHQRVFGLTSRLQRTYKRTFSLLGLAEVEEKAIATAT
jgi:hypothetical protein